MIETSSLYSSWDNVTDYCIGVGGTNPVRMHGYNSSHTEYGRCNYLGLS